MSTPRTTEARIDWFLSHNPSGSGMCAQHSWHSLGGDYGNPPAWGCKNANAVYDKVKASGRYWTTEPPRGALVLWKYGNNGHAAISYGSGKIATTDPTNKPGKTGVEPLSYPKKWGAGSYIWTDQYNGVRFSVASSGPGNVYVSKLVKGQKDSDSVSRLQATLNGVKLSGGSNLPITGNYGDQTANEVMLWQTQKATDKSVINGSLVTAAQAEELFAGTGNKVIDDTTPEPEVPDPGPETEPYVVDQFGLWKWYSGKKTNEVTIPNGEWKNLDIGKQPVSGIKEDSSEHHFLYLRIALPPNRTASRVIETRFVRSNGDETAYIGPEWTAGSKDSIPYMNIHFEDGSGLGGQWQIKVTGGKDPIKITTRYAKTHILYVDPTQISAAAVERASRQVGGRLGAILRKIAEALRDDRERWR